MTSATSRCVRYAARKRRQPPARVVDQLVGEAALDRRELALLHPAQPHHLLVDEIETAARVELVIVGLVEDIPERLEPVAANQRQRSGIAEHEHRVEVGERLHRLLRDSRRTRTHLGFGRHAEPRLVVLGQIGRESRVPQLEPLPLMLLHAQQDSTTRIERIEIRRELGDLVVESRERPREILGSRPRLFSLPLVRVPEPSERHKAPIPEPVAQQAEQEQNLCSARCSIERDEATLPSRRAVHETPRAASERLLRRRARSARTHTRPSSRDSTRQRANRNRSRRNTLDSPARTVDPA